MCAGCVQSVADTSCKMPLLEATSCKLPQTQSEDQNALGMALVEVCKNNHAQYAGGAPFSTQAWYTELLFACASNSTLSCISENFSSADSIPSYSTSSLVLHAHVLMPAAQQSATGLTYDQFSMRSDPQPRLVAPGPAAPLMGLSSLGSGRRPQPTREITLRPKDKSSGAEPQVRLDSPPPLGGDHIMTISSCTQRGWPPGGGGGGGGFTT
jgi:hypothetical protein